MGGEVRTVAGAGPGASKEQRNTPLQQIWPDREPRFPVLLGVVADEDDVDRPTEWKTGLRRGTMDVRVSVCVYVSVWEEEECE